MYPEKTQAQLASARRRRKRVLAAICALQAGSFWTVAVNGAEKPCFAYQLVADLCQIWWNYKDSGSRPPKSLLKRVHKFGSLPDSTWAAQTSMLFKLRSFARRTDGQMSWAMFR